MHFLLSEDVLVAPLIGSVSEAVVVVPEGSSVAEALVVVPESSSVAEAVVVLPESSSVSEAIIMVPERSSVSEALVVVPKGKFRFQLQCFKFAVVPGVAEDVVVVVPEIGPVTKGVVVNVLEFICTFRSRLVSAALWALLGRFWAMFCKCSSQI